MPRPITTQPSSARTPRIARRTRPTPFTFLLVALFLLVAGAARPAAAQEGPTGVVRGTVADAEGEPVQGAQVTLDGTRFGARGDFLGRFILTAPAGSFRLRVRALGYRLDERAVTVRPGETTTVAIVLTAVPLRLDPVRATAQPREREEFERSPDVGVFSMRGSTLRAVPPLGEPDVLRAVQLLPGVVARSDYTAGYNVRGGESDQNLVLLDGIPVYNPFHLGGLFGTFLDETVADVNLLTGGFPASYGGRLSSVLEVGTADEARQGVHGAVTVSMLSTSGAVGGTLPNARTSWGIAGRRTYADALASAVTEDGFPYYFWDGQLKLRHLLKSGGLFSVTAYGGTDNLDGTFAQFELDDEEEAVPADDGNFRFGWGNRLVGVTFLQPLPPGSRIPLGGGKGIALGDSARLELRGSITGFDTELDLGDGAFILDNAIREHRATGSLTWFEGSRARRMGLELSRHAVRYDAEAPDAGIDLLGLSQDPIALSAYWDDTWRATARWLVRYGARAEHLTERDWTGISPRVSVKFFWSPELAFTAAGGRYTQWMHSLTNEDVPVRVFNPWIASDQFVPVSTADHAILGAERWFGDNRFVRVEAWGKRYGDVTEFNDADDPRMRGDEFTYVDGTSYGGDVLLRQLDAGALSGWVSYGYAVSRRQRQGRAWAPAQDRRHNVNAVATWRLPRRWQLAGRLGYGSGIPFTDIEGQIVRRIYNAGTGTWDTGIVDRDIEPVGGDRNGRRYPFFGRMDLTVTRTATWRGTTLLPYLSVVNVTNRRNVFVYTFDYTENPPTRKAFSQFPILPSLGLTVQF